MYSKKYNKRKVGAYFEDQAANHLIAKGYNILERNLYTPFGEIDLLAEDKNTLVFCEIKYRSSLRYGYPSEAVDYNKQKRLSKAALYYYSYHGFSSDRACRFDVIAIYKDKGIEHIENAFMFF